MNLVRTRRIVVRRQRELLCAMAFQEFEWHAIKGVDYEDVQDEIPEISFESRRPLLHEVDPVCRS